MKPFHVSFLMALALTTPKVGWGQERQLNPGDVVTIEIPGIQDTTGKFLGADPVTKEFLIDTGSKTVKVQPRAVGFRVAYAQVSGTPVAAPAPVAAVAPAGAPVVPPAAGVVAPPAQAAAAKQDPAPAVPPVEKEKTPEEIAAAEAKAKAELAAAEAKQKAEEDKAKEKAVADSERSAQLVVEEMTDFLTQAPEKLASSDCPICERFTLQDAINTIAEKFQPIADISAALTKKLTRTVEAAKKAGRQQALAIAIEAEIERIVAKAPERGAQWAYDGIKNALNRFTDRSKEGQAAKSAACIKAARAVRKIEGKEIADERDSDDEDFGDFAVAGQNPFTSAALQQPRAEDIQHSGLSSLDDIDLDEDQSGLGRFRAASDILKECEKGLSGDNLKAVRAARRRNDDRAINYLASLGNYGLAFLNFITSYRNSFGRDYCAGRQSIGCFAMGARIEGAKKFALQTQKGASALSAAWDPSALNINLGTNTPSVVKDASGTDITFPGMTDFNNRLIQGTVPAENPLTKPSLDATVTPPVFSTGLALPVVGGRS